MKSLFYNLISPYSSVTPRSPVDTAYSFNSKIDYIARLLTLLGIFFLPFSPSLNNLISVAAFLSLFGGQLRDRIAIIAQLRMNYAALALIVLLGLSLSYSIADFSQSFHQFWKYTHKILTLFLLIPLFIEARWRRYAINTLLCSLFLAQILYIFYPLTNNYSLLILHKPLNEVTDAIPLSIASAFAAFVVLHRIIDEISASFKLSTLALIPKKSLMLLALIHTIVNFLSNKKHFFSISLFSFFAIFILYFNIERTGIIIFILLISLLCWQRINLRCALLALVLLSGFTYLTSFSFHWRINNVFKELQLTYNAYKNREAYSTVVAPPRRTSSGLRVAFIRGSLQLIKRRPLLGYGSGSFPIAYDNIQGVRMDPLNPLGDPHNSYLHLSVQIGLIGLFIFLLWLLWQWQDSQKLPKLEARQVQGLIIAFATANFFISALLRNQASMLYITFLAILFAAYFDDSPSKNLQK